MAIIRGGQVDEEGVYTSEGRWLVSETKSCQELLQPPLKRGIEENEAWLTLIEKIGKTLLDYKKELLEKIKPELIEFSLRVCERVLRNELADPENLTRLIDSLFSSAFSLFEEEKLTLFLAPHDLARLEASLLSEKKWEMVRLCVDPMMQTGDVRIETKTRMCRYDLSRELALIQENVLQRTAHVSTSPRS
ncbi:MAG: hypothetical protein K940chlam9_00236 [Chlamydiae bacterium]|nr:hypothetical protein [Chlamydiota bacterium]